MFQNIRHFLRFSLIEFNKIIQFKEFSLKSLQKTLPSNLESIQTSNSLRLVTAFYGVSKEVFFNESTKRTLNGKKFTFGDDSW